MEMASPVFPYSLVSMAFPYKCIKFKSDEWEKPSGKMAYCKRCGAGLTMDQTRGSRYDLVKLDAHFQPQHKPQISPKI
jgi:hypothetical protein